MNCPARSSSFSTHGALFPAFYDQAALDADIAGDLAQLSRYLALRDMNSVSDLSPELKGPDPAAHRKRLGQRLAAGAHQHAAGRT